MSINRLCIANYGKPKIVLIGSEKNLSLNPNLLDIILRISDLKNSQWTMDYRLASTNVLPMFLKFLDSPEAKKSLN